MNHRMVAVAIAALAPMLAGCLGDGVHAEVGLFYSAGSRVGEECRYGALDSDGPGTGIESVVLQVVAPEGTGGRYFEVPPDAAGFASSGCEKWMPAGTLNPVRNTSHPVPPGMFRVGHDIDIGVYEAVGAAGCMWMHFGGAGPSETAIASGSGAGRQVAVLEEAGGFFHSEGCGPFRYLGTRSR